MAKIPFKLRNTPARETLKKFKDGFDDTSLITEEPSVYRAASLSAEPMIIVWRGELFHQLALRHERRGQTKTAIGHYEESLRSFRSDEYLGPARAKRDYALLLSRYGDVQAGLAMAYEAYALHDADIEKAKVDRDALAKGRRQQRITQGYVWRAEYYAGVNPEHALDQLVELALYDSHDFCLRDQQILVDFAIAHTAGPTHRALHARQLKIRSDQKKLFGMLVSIANLVIDTELIVVERMLRKLIRRE